jgi:hypothetical protein
MVAPKDTQLPTGPSMEGRTVHEFSPKTQNLLTDLYRGSVDRGVSKDLMIHPGGHISTKTEAEKPKKRAKKAAKPAE